MLKTHDRRSTKICKLKFKSLGSFTFGNNDKLKVIWVGNIELKSNFIIRKILFVEKFKFNLLRVSELYDVCYKVKF